MSHTTLRQPSSLNRRPLMLLQGMFGERQLHRYALRQYAKWRVGATKEETYSDDERIVFTFDDYGTPAQVRRLLAVLEQHNVRAVFFVCGNWAYRHPELIADITTAGHLIGNHTYSHPDLLALPEVQVRQEITEGVPSPWLRPPRGRYNRRIRQLAREQGMSIKYWSVDSNDWQGEQADAMYHSIVPQLHAGAVILFHIHASETAKLLPKLITAIRQKGLKLPTFDEKLWGVK